MLKLIVTIILLLIVCAITSIIVFYPLARFSKSLKRFYCWLGWHSYDYEYESFSGVNIHAKCKWCKYKGIIDSQGNLF